VSRPALGEDRVVHKGKNTVFHSIPFPSSGSPYGGPSGSPYGGPSGSPYGGPSGSPYGGPSGSPYGGPYGSPFGRRDGPLTLDDLADVCRETQAIEGLAFANFLLRARSALARWTIHANN
jgi:hypothetical protein